MGNFGTWAYLLNVTISYELWSTLLKGGHMKDSIADYCIEVIKGRLWPMC